MFPRLYAILDIDLVRDRGLEPAGVLRDWLTAGVRLIQLRAKGLSFGPFLELAGQMAAACRAADASFIINDRADVAQLAKAAGVHLGQTDLSPAEARLVLPDAPWVGLSTHTDAQVASALASAATYLAIGPVFPTKTKVHADPVIGLEGVARAAPAVKGTGRPLVAIGGITLASAPDVMDAGASAVAVISDLLEGETGRRAEAYLKVLGT